MDLPHTTEGWAFFLDIDGTLLEIAPTPDAVVVPPDLPPLLDAICRRADGALAPLTGRDAATGDRLFAPFRLPVGAVHGSLIRDAAGDTLGAPPDPKLPEIRTRLAAFVAAHPTALLEDKGTAVALHFRADPSLAGPAEATVRAAVAGASGLTVQPGKMVFEIRPARADKGAALATFMATAAYHNRRPVAVGDDLTDESMFAAALAAGGMALRVGDPSHPGDSRASVAFETPHDVRRWLARLSWV